MRNLKRALSLGLTAAMISGLMVMGSSAVSYPDSDQIQNQTAVEILGEIGVMVGDDNGNFNPTQDVTRAEMAVIITRILYGNDLNVDQFKGMNLFTDVPAWAEGFVNLCASLDIVAGVGDGKFAPNETVTAAQAALMLSRALGYFQNNAEFGNDWALAAIRRATSAGIIGDDMVLAANEGLSRDNVAQMTFNTLTKAVPVQYNELLNVYYNENQGITYALTFNYLQTLGYTNFDLVYDNGDTTIYGRPATTWGIGSYRTNTLDQDSGSRYDAELDANGGLISSKVQILSRDEIITIENEPTYVYTDATDEEDIYDDLGATICDEDEYDWSAYVNGEEVASADVVVPGRNVSADYAYTDKGAQTEIYVDDGDKTVTVVEINYYMGRVASVNEDDGTVTIRTISDAELDDRDFATTEFAKDDYVVYTIDQNADDDFYICEMMEPETVTGTVTKVQNNASADNACLFLDDEKQSYSTHMVYDLNDEGNARHPSTNKEYTLYLDPNGYVLAYSGDTTKSFLYVEDSDEERNHWDTDVVLADGTATTVQVEDEMKKWDDSALYDFLYNGAGDDLTSNQNTANEDDIDWLDINNQHELDVYVQMFNDIGANIDADELDEFSRLNTDVSEIDYQIWEYTTNDNDEYTLSGRLTRYAEDVEIVNGRSWMLDVDNTNEGIFSGDISVDNSTVFVDVESGTAYVGRDNVPDVSNARIAYLLENDDYARDVAEIVYILDGDIYDADRIFFVITDAARYTVEYEDELYFQFDNLYVDGRKTDDLYVAYDALTNVDYLGGIDSLDNYDNDEDDNNAVTNEIKNELAGKVIEVKKSIDGTYATEIEVHPFWDAPITVSETMLDLANNWFEADLDNWHFQKWNTDADTLFVMVTEEYNRRLTEIDGYKVTVEDDDDIVAWENENRFVGTDEDGYATLVQVVKGEDQNADLVYIYKFMPEYHFRTVTINVNGVEYDRYDGEDSVFCQTWLISPDTAVKAFEAKMVAAGFNTEKNKYVYTVAGYEGDFAGDVQDFNTYEDEAGVWDDIAIPTGHDDLVINIIATNEDVKVDSDTGLILDVTAVDAASPAYSIDVDRDGTIRYAFQVKVPTGTEIENVTWMESVVLDYENSEGNKQEKTAYAGDSDFIYDGTVTDTEDGIVYDVYRVQESAVGSFNASDVKIIRVTNAEVNGAPEVETVTLTLKGEPLNNAEVWNADGSERLDNADNTTEYINGDKEIELTVPAAAEAREAAGMTVQLKFEEGYNGLYFIGENVVDLGKDGIWTKELTGDTILDSSELNIRPAAAIDVVGSEEPVYGEVVEAGVKVTVPKENEDGTVNAGNYFKSGETYTAYGDYVTVNADAEIELGYIKVTVEKDEGEDWTGYRKAGEALSVDAEEGSTSFMYTVGGGEKQYAAYKKGISADKVTDDVVIAKGYIKVTVAKNADEANVISEITKGGEQYVLANATSVTVTIKTNEIANGTYEVKYQNEKGGESFSATPEKIFTNSMGIVEKEITITFTASDSDRAFTLKMA